MTGQEKIDALIKEGWTEDPETGELVKGEMRFQDVDEAYFAEFGESAPEL